MAPSNSAGSIDISALTSQLSRMCNRYGYQHPLNALPDEFSDLGPIRWDGLAPNAPLDQIRPTDRAPIIRPVDSVLELAVIRCGLVPWFHKGPLKDFKGLNTNARSETVSTLANFKGPYARRRCLVPATQYFEWTTDPANPKVASSCGGSPYPGGLRSRWRAFGNAPACPMVRSRASSSSPQRRAPISRPTMTASRSCCARISGRSG